MPAVPLLKATAGNPIRSLNSFSNAVRLGPTVESQLEENAPRTYSCSLPPMCGTDRRTRFISGMNQPENARRNAGHRGGRRYGLQHYRSSANDCTFANQGSRQRDRAEANMGKRADIRSASEHGPGGYVDVIAHDAIVFNDGCRVHNTVATDTHTGINDCARHHHSTGPNSGRGRDRRSGMNNYGAGQAVSVCHVEARRAYVVVANAYEKIPEAIPDGGGQVRAAAQDGAAAELFSSPSGRVIDEGNLCKCAHGMHAIKDHFRVSAGAPEQQCCHMR